VDDDAAMIDVRPRTPDDLAGCVELAREVHAMDGYPSFLGDGGFEQFVAPDDALGAWVATRGDDVVGNVLLRPRSAPVSIELAAASLAVDAARLGFVARLMVAPRARRHGLARRLLDVVVHEARRRRLVTVLDVVATDVGAVALYEATGWRRLGALDQPLRDGRTLALVVFAAP
jgi:ribosomal protein S18 acetylase RimI-like enzyme